jgi:molybdate transport system substrate-binding protein
VRRALALALLIVVASGIAGCGSGGGTTSGGGRASLTVSAASSLERALTRYSQHVPGAAVREQFAGSDELAAQIRQGVRPDVFAAANTKLPEALYAEGQVEKPVIFAGNRLVLAVPAGSAMHTLQDAARPGVKLAIGSAGVPVGQYTRTVLARLAPAEQGALLHAVRTEEPDVKGVVGKLTQGAVDAGFVYITDVEAAGGRLRAIELPARVRPSVAYGAAVVKGTAQPRLARAYIAGLLTGPGRAALRDAGFEPPPSQR